MLSHICNRAINATCGAAQGGCRSQASLGHKAPIAREGKAAADGG